MCTHPSQCNDHQCCPCHMSPLCGKGMHPLACVVCLASRCLLQALTLWLVAILFLWTQTQSWLHGPLQPLLLLWCAGKCSVCCDSSVSWCGTSCCVVDCCMPVSLCGHVVSSSLLSNHPLPWCLLIIVVCLPHTHSGALCVTANLNPSLLCSCTKCLQVTAENNSSHCQTHKNFKHSCMQCL